MKPQETREEKIARLIRQSGDIKSKDFLAGIQMAKQALDLARGSSPDEPVLPEKLAESQFILGVLQGEAYEQDEALGALFEAYAIFSQLGNPTRQAEALLAISQVYRKCHDHDLALEYAARALRAFETLRDRENEARTLYAIGCMYLKSGFLSVAMNYFNKATSIARELSNDQIEANALEQMAVISLQQKEYSASLGHSLKSLEIHQRNGNSDAQVKSLLLMSRVHQQLNANEDAWDCLNQSLLLARKSGSLETEKEALLHIGKFYTMAGELEKAVQSLEQALEKNQQQVNGNGPKLLAAEIHQSLSQAFSKQTKYQEALDHYRQFHEIEKKNLQSEYESMIKGQQVAHRMETARKEAEIFELRNVELRQEIEERIHIQAELEKNIIIDPLTGCFNRRHWIDLAQREINRSTRYQHPLSVIILDIEQLRSINALHGREAGDKAIQQMVQRCQKNLRKPDILARSGEDEFVILLPQTAHKGAQLLAERLREDIEAVSDDKIPIKVSIGTAGLKLSEDLTAEALLDRVIHSLYQEKTARRDLKSG